MLNPVPLTSIGREPANPGIYQPAGSNNRDDILIDEKLADVVALHFARLLSPRLRARNPAAHCLSSDGRATARHSRF